MHAPDCLIDKTLIKPAKDRSMPEIFVYMFEGRTLDQKRALVRALTDGASASLGVPEDTVTVQLIESAKSMRSRGGVLFSDRVPAPAALPSTSPSTPSETKDAS
ncbi:tautomerase family protein [Variovorax sp. VNK109]|uniref:tautomerase family protein n=1 Tax=Variovorax sp. VNK109 TaxID=3400919 RepID=UPI003C087A3C